MSSEQSPITNRSADCAHRPDCVNGVGAIAGLTLWLENPDTSGLNNADLKGLRAQFLEAFEFKDFCKDCPLFDTSDQTETPR